MGEVVWSIQSLKVNCFLEMFKSAENGQILLAVKYPYFGHFFEKAVIQRQMETIA